MAASRYLFVMPGRSSISWSPWLQKRQKSSPDVVTRGIRQLPCIRLPPLLWLQTVPRTRDVWQHRRRTCYDLCLTGRARHGRLKGGCPEPRAPWQVSARGIVVQAEIALGNNEKALEIASEGLLAMQQQGDHLSLSEAHRHIAAAQLASSLHEEARQSALAARNSSERLLGTRKWECKADALEMLAEICRQTKDFQAMTQAAEEGHDRFLKRW
eukprot:s4047_g4.t1